MPLKPDFKDKNTLEKYSSAITMSDMEIFVFPELLYPLVLANIMSPLIWQWREDPWFKNVHKKSFTYKINRIKQYIMDHFVFNLDLDTWGLTTKEAEIDRFKDFVDMDLIRQSNALFGYEGDKYYFSIDIRRHFGLEKYESNVIPYWKTETIEAMTAFKYKESFTAGAGECVSLSVLYAAALFIVGRIPLEEIFLIGTPLHSQNFINVNEGVLTNNRRIVTKSMWFNGSSLSTRARRALENENVSMVAHVSGFIHNIYPSATINKEAYSAFKINLKKFLTIDLSPVVFISFLRYHMNFKKCFQYRHVINGRAQYIGLETIFEYEHSTKHVFAEATREALLAEIEDEEFSLAPLANRIVIQEMEEFLNANKTAGLKETMEFFIKHAKATNCNNEDKIGELFTELEHFLNVEPKLPSADKEFTKSEQLRINADQSREDIINLVFSAAENSEEALLALHAFRQMDKIDWTPFLKATLERNPVANEGLKGMSPETAYNKLLELENESIYDSNRLAQPDEVWNFRRGDGVEKALVLANYLKKEMKEGKMILSINKSQVILKTTSSEYVFTSSKELVKTVEIE